MVKERVVCIEREDWKRAKMMFIMIEQSVETNVCFFMKVASVCKLHLRSIVWLWEKSLVGVTLFEVAHSFEDDRHHTSGCRVR